MTTHDMEGRPAQMSEQTPSIVPSRPVPMLLTVEQAAAELGIGRTTMYALIRDGVIESVRIGRLRRVRRTDLATYVERLGAAA